MSIRSRSTAAPAAFLLVAALTALAAGNAVAQDTAGRATPMDVVGSATPQDVVGSATPQDVVGRAMQRSLLSHNTIPLLDSVLGDGAAADAQAKAVHWTEHGMTRLSPARMVDRVRLEQVIVSHLDTINCAGALTGITDPAALSHAVASIDSATIQEWIDLAVDALMADARNRPAPGVLTRTDVSHLHDGTAASLPAADRDRYRAIVAAYGLPQPPSASCWAVHQILDHIMTEDSTARARDARTWVLLRAGVRPVAG